MAQDTRDQKQNKRLAFRRMAESARFQAWQKMETARKLGTLKIVEENVEAAMAAHNLRIEGKKDGKWTELESIPEQPDHDEHEQPNHTKDSQDG